MSCCICNGSCCHVGPHSYCVAHRPGQSMPPPVTWPWPQPHAVEQYRPLSPDDIEKIARRVAEILDRPLPPAGRGQPPVY